MSLLMEALRKAEEAKREGESNKELDQGQQPDQPETEVELGLQDSVPEAESPRAHNEDKGTGDLQADFDAALTHTSHSGSKTKSLENEDPGYEPQFEIEPQENPLDSVAESTKSDIDAEEAVEDGEGSAASWEALDLHPIQEDSQLDTAAPITLEEESSYGGAEEISADEGEAPAQLSVEVSPEDSTEKILVDDYASGFSERGETDGEGDLEEADAWKSRARRISNPRDYKKIAFTVIILLLLVGGGLFWYLGSESAPEIASANPDRGFLGGADPLETSQLEESPLDIPSQNEVFSQTGSSSIASVGTSDEEVAGSIVVGGDLDSGFEPSLNANQTSRSFSQIGQTDVFKITSPTRSSELNDLQSEAAAAAQSGYNSHAREQYEWLLSVEPNNSEALLGLARLDTVEGNAEAARDKYLRLIELNPADPLARAGLLSLGQGDPLSQEAELKSLAQRYPDAAPLSFALGNLLASQRRWNEAEGAYSRALISAKASGGAQLSPDYSFNLAVALEQLSRPEDAYVNYLEALELSDDVAPSFDLDLLTSRIQQLGQKIR